MPDVRTICVVTGTRAEYGLLRPVMQAIRSAPDLKLQTVATGAHLLPGQGRTVETMIADGFPPDVEVDLVVGGDTRRALGKSVGLGVVSMVDALDRLAPDVVLVLGDRYEILSASTAALALQIPLAHMEGGHVTEGAVDDSIRHAVTKMAAIHFTAAERYGARLVQMGEQPSTVHVVGSTGIDNILGLPRMTRAALAEDIGIPLEAPLFVVTHHPVTAGAASTLDEVGALCAAIEAAGPGSVVVTGANADPEGEAVNARFQAFVAERPDVRRFVQSLGAERYLSLLGEADLAIGNSSSGVIEAPSLGVPTVNIGDRQKGRLRAPSVIDCAPDQRAIEGAIRQALSPDFKAIAAGKENPMGDGRAAARIVGALKIMDLTAAGRKAFFDLDTNAIGAPQALWGEN